MAKSAHLRAAGRIALERRFSNVQIGQSQGVIPGARLEFVDEGVPKSAAVRTSTDREVGLLRNEDGEWRTLRHVELVLVAAESKEDRDVIEVMAFAPEKLAAQFDLAVGSMEKGNRSKSRFKAPVFLPLDARKRGAKAAEAGLSFLREWIEKIPRSEVSTHLQSSTGAQDVERVRAGIARGLGVSPDRIELSFSFRVKEPDEE